MIAQETIKAVEENVNIVDVINDYVNLKKKGANWQSPCPFHDEKTASFVVSPAKGMFKCFGCGVGGNAIKFVMQHESYSYPEAIKYLADKLNIEFILEDIDPKTKDNLLANESIMIMNEFAVKNFMQNITPGSPQEKYLKEERKFDDKVINLLQLGYAPKDYRTLYNKCIEQNFSHEQILKSDLAYEKDGNVLDKYRDRIIFPIHNLSGRVIGFSARILDKTSTLPKYVNTTENEIYHKSNVLYGLFHAKKEITKKKEAYLVEGNADVAKLFQHNIMNVVASSGTALTLSQIKMIRRFTDHLTFLYDGDNAGLKAASKGMELAIETGMHIKGVKFKNNEDPDSFVSKYGPEQFIKYVDENKHDIIDFFFEDWAKFTTEEKDETGKIILRLIAKIPTDQIFRIKAYATKLSQIFRVALPKINKRINETRAGIETKGKIIDLIEEPTPNNHEIEFVKVLMLHGNKVYFSDYLCYYYMMEESCLPEQFKNPLAANIFSIYYEALKDNIVPDLDFFINHEDAEVGELAKDLVFKQNTISASWGNGVTIPEVDYLTVVKNVTSFLRIYKIKEFISDNQTDISTASSDRIEELMKKDASLKAKLSEECQKIKVNLV